MQHDHSTHRHCGDCLLASLCKIDEQSTRWLKHRSLKRKESLYFSETKFKSLYIIQEGIFKVYQTEAGGKELIRGFYFAGEVLGYEAIHSGQYLFSAAALSESSVCEVPYEYFLQLIQSTTHLQKYTLALMSKQLHIGAYLGFTLAEQRLAAFLLDLSSRLRTKNHFTLPMSRQDIGNYLRLTAETVSRLFTRLQRNKMIAIKHKTIHFLEPDKLKQLANGLL